MRRAFLLLSILMSLLCSESALADCYDVENRRPCQDCFPGGGDYVLVVHVPNERRPADTFHPRYDTLDEAERSLQSRRRWDDFYYSVFDSEQRRSYNGPYPVCARPHRAELEATLDYFLETWSKNIERAVKVAVLQKVPLRPGSILDRIRKHPLAGFVTNVNHQKDVYDALETRLQTAEPAMDFVAQGIADLMLTGFETRHYAAYLPPEFTIDPPVLNTVPSEISDIVTKRLRELNQPRLAWRLQMGEFEPESLFLIDEEYQSCRDDYLRELCLSRAERLRRRLEQCHRRQIPGDACRDAATSTSEGVTALVDEDDSWKSAPPSRAKRSTSKATPPKSKPCPRRRSTSSRRSGGTGEMVAESAREGNPCR